MTLPKPGSRTTVALTAFACLALAFGWPEWRMEVQAIYYKTGTIHDLGTLGGTLGYAFDINGKRQVTGYSTLSDGSARAFLWENGVMQDLGTLGGSSSFALALNDRGQVVGISETAGALNHAFLWENGVMTDIGPPASGFSLAQDINHRGQITGFFYDARGGRHAYLWERSRFIDLTSMSDEGVGTGLNEGSQLVGYSAPISLPFRATLWDRSGQQDLGTLGGASSIAMAINRQGQIAGYSVTVGEAATHAFLWENGVLTDLGTLGGVNSLARSIDDLGRVIGFSYTASDQQHGFIWEAGVMTDLNTLLPANSGWTLLEAAGINKDGLIVGQGINPDGQLRPYLFTP